MCFAHVWVIRCRGSIGAAAVGPWQRNGGAVQDRTARGGLKGRRRHRRSGLRWAHHFAPSLREPPRLTRRRAVLQRRHCQQAASNDARRSTRVVVVPSRHREGVVVGDRYRCPREAAQCRRATSCRAGEGDAVAASRETCGEQRDARIPEIVKIADRREHEVPIRSGR